MDCDKVHSVRSVRRSSVIAGLVDMPLSFIFLLKLYYQYLFQGLLLILSWLMKPLVSKVNVNHDVTLGRMERRAANMSGLHIARPVRTLPRPIPPLAHGRHGRRVTERVTLHHHLSFICSGIVPVLWLDFCWSGIWLLDCLLDWLIDWLIDWEKEDCCHGCQPLEAPE